MRFPRGTDPLTLDEEILDRFLRGAIGPDEVPPSYRRVAQLVQALTAPAIALDLEQEGRTVRSMASAVASAASGRQHPLPSESDRGQSHRP